MQESQTFFIIPLFTSATQSAIPAISNVPVISTAPPAAPTVPPPVWLPSPPLVGLLEFFDASGFDGLCFGSGGAAAASRVVGFGERYLVAAAASGLIAADFGGNGSSAPDT
jgi:hypothetical protein